MLSTSQFPLKSTVTQGSFFGTGNGFESTIDLNPIIGLELNSRFTTASRDVGRFWNVQLHVGAGLEASFFTNQVETYHVPSVFSTGSPYFSEGTVETMHLVAFVDNLLVFSKRFEKFQLEAGLNFRCRYGFYAYSEITGMEREVGTIEETALSDQGGDFTDLWFWLEDFYLSSFQFQGLFTIRPTAAKGLYFTMRLPLHPVVQPYAYSANYYGFSAGLGYQFVTK